jgi:uncharacterized protein with PIN domain
MVGVEEDVPEGSSEYRRREEGCRREEAIRSLLKRHDELKAFEKYGRSRHPADLNFGDCFAYACARAYRAPLLFKGNDFSQTDINDFVRR